MGSCTRRSRESTAVKNFVMEYLKNGSTASTCEEIYQLLHHTLRTRVARECLKQVKKVSRTFVNESIEKTNEMELEDVGRYLYGFNCHWDRTMNLFEKVFRPITPIGRNLMEGLFSRLFRRFVRGVEGRLTAFMTWSLKEEIERKGDGGEAAVSSYENYESSPNKKQKVSQSSPAILKKTSGREEDPRRFESLCRREQITAIVHILQSRGCFGIFLERVVECLIAALSSRVEDKEVEIFGIKDLIDEYRKAEYMKDYFYAVESGLIRRVVMKYTNEEIFRMLCREDEMRLCMDFFCISNSEKRLVEALGEYCREIIENLSADGFITGYYWIYLKFRDVEKCKDDGYEEISEGIRRCKKDVVNSNVERVVECICGWTDSLLRGRMSIEKTTIEGMDHRIQIPGSREKDVLETRGVLKRLGIDEVLLEGGVWKEYLLSNIFRAVGEIFDLCNDKKAFEMALQNRLGNRLISQSSVSMYWENLLIDGIDPGRNSLGKMRCMIRDFSERELFMGHEVLLLRACKWPGYEGTSLGIPDVEEVKGKYEDALRNKKKRIRWNDLLSSCSVEILGHAAAVTLTQYLMIRQLAEKDRAAEDLKIYKGWDENLGALVKNGLVRADGRRYFLNMDWEGNCSGNRLIPDTFPLVRLSEAARGFDKSESCKDLLDCRIIKEMKNKRVLDRDELRRLMGREYSSEALDERIESLAGREFLSIEGESIRYLP
uniref:Cullin N-terminal domain-containing protein n=1 Tax=Encephalitozoon cuniculi TaxID=6035 RepID=M1JL95_ENCCN|nr:hypothetical protein ECU09_1810 [Encephalitozoon cuniculi]